LKTRIYFEGFREDYKISLNGKKSILIIVFFLNFGNLEGIVSKPYDMSKTAFTIRIYSFYLFFMGSVMVFIPNILLRSFGFAETQEIWIRVLGLFTITTGYYYFYSSGKDQLGFFWATIPGRLFFFLGTLIFVFIFHQSLMLAGVGSIDLMGALWTLYVYNKSKIS